MDHPLPEIDGALQASLIAFESYRAVPLPERARFLTAIATGLDAISGKLVETAARETHLAPARLRTELERTQWQLHSYGAACAEGAWLDIRIDRPKEVGSSSQIPAGDDRRQTPNSELRTPSWHSHVRQNDLRKMLVPLGPVVVFGASNFPFAYSTAGGDTACALAAGCPVLLKADPAHAETSRLVAEAVRRAAIKTNLPEALFQHIEGDLETGQALVLHPLTKAVGFTGSLEGGRALYDLAAGRKTPIPVFAEMGSANPVFLLPERLSSHSSAIARELLASVSGSAGQFCTKPGLIVGIGSAALEGFAQELAEGLSLTPPVEMLHPGIAKAFQQRRADALGAPGVTVAGTLSCPVGRNDSIPTLARVDAAAFLANPQLHTEVFGPFALLVVCHDDAQMLLVAEALEGQLTATIHGTGDEIAGQMPLLRALHERCGRLIQNGVPTGVEVVPAMMHGGPYPATTDSRFTAVGPDGIRRFARPVCFQNWDDRLLPPELQNANPLGIARTVNDVLTKDAI